MADITSEQIDELVKQLGKSAGALTSIAEKSGSRSSGGGVGKGVIDATTSDTEKAKKDAKIRLMEFNSGVGSSANSLRDFSKSTEGLTGAIQSIAMHIPGGFIFAEMAKYAQGSIETYKDLTNYGEYFGGSMLNMSRAAAEAGLPLEDFGKAIKQNSVLVKNMGVKDFGKLQQNVRTLSDQYGNYGLSLEQMMEMTGKYAETMRLSGRSAKGLVNIAPEINEFALNMSTMAGITGKNREELEKQTFEIINDPLFRAKSADNLRAGLEGYNKAVRGAVMQLTAQTGEAGELGKALAEASSNVGGVNFTDFGKMVNDLGQSNISQMIDDANARLQRGEDVTQVSSDLISKVKQQLSDPAVTESLQLQASMGDQNAKKMLAMGQELKNYSEADIKSKAEAAKSMDGLTAFMSSFKSTMGSLFGKFIDGFLTPFTEGNKEAGIKDFFSALERVKPQLQELGKTFGELFKAVFNPATLSSVATLFKLMANATTGVIIPLFMAFTKLATMVLGPVVAFFNGIIGWFNTLGDNLEGAFGGGEIGKTIGDFTKVIGLAIVGLGLLTAYLVGKAMFSKNKTAVMNVNAAVVNISGGMGGGGGGSIFDKLMGGKKEKAYGPHLPPGATDNVSATGKGKKGIFGTIKGVGAGMLGMGLEGAGGGGIAELALGMEALAPAITAIGGALLGAAPGIAVGTLAIIGLAGAFALASIGFEPFGKMIKSTFEGVAAILTTVGPIIEGIGKAIASVYQAIGGAISGVINSVTGSLMMISTIDPIKLMALVPSIIGVGGAMAAFGAGSMIAGVGGNMAKVGSLAAAAASGNASALFGKGSPTDRLNTEKPKEIDEREIQRGRPLADGSDERTIKALERIEEAVKHNTNYVHKGNKADQRQSRELKEAFSSGAAR